jgi:TPR repeat protein
MKKYLLLWIVSATVCMGCTDQQFQENALADFHQQNSNNEINTLIEQARWGDGQAFLKLADCYRDGNGVEKDFVGMLCMLAQAREYGGIDCMEDYLKKLPEGSDFKMIFDAINKFEDTQIDEANLMAEQIIAKGSPDGYTVQGIMAIENGDTVGGRRLMEQAAAQGSTFAELMLFFSEWNTHNTPNMERLKELSDKMPLANAILAKFYAKSERNEHLAAHYYLKADEKAFLGKRGARWLLSNRQFVDNLSLSERDIERLQTLAGERVIEESDEIIEVDTLGTE